MKRLLEFIMLITMFFAFTMNAKAATINLFYGQECPHCEKEIEYLETLKNQYGDELDIKKYEVWHNNENSELLNEVKKYFKDTKNSVPYTVIGYQTYTGFNDNVATKIKKDIINNLKKPEINVVEYIEKGKTVPNNITKKQEDTNISVPFLGEVDAKVVSLPLLALIIGLVDGFNPCAMWVLLFLISILIGMNDRKRMWILGLTFLITSALIYLLFMIAWLGIAVSAMQQVLLRSVIALFAIVMGTINLKSYFKSLENPSGCSVINETKRQKIFNKIKKFTREKKFVLAIIGVMSLAVTVNLVELACSSGLPLLFTGVLAMNDLTTFQYCLNLFIYIFMFLIDDIIIFIIAMKTMGVTGISTKYNKYSHLISGIIMLLIGVLLLLKPEWIMFNF